MSFLVKLTLNFEYDVDRKELDFQKTYYETLNFVFVCCFQLQALIGIKQKATFIFLIIFAKNPSTILRLRQVFFLHLKLLTLRSPSNCHEALSFESYLFLSK